MLDVRDSILVGNKKFTIYSLKKAEASGLNNIKKLPRSLKVLMENLLRKQNNQTVVFEDIKALNDWVIDRKCDREICYHPARVIMQDFTGVPAVVDLASMREAMGKVGGDVKKINPQIPVDLVIDHSLQVEHFGNEEAFLKNVQIEYQRNNERYRFLKWGQTAFDNFRVIPPGTGIIHQVNLEYLAKVVWQQELDGQIIAYPDTCVGTDSHTTMINGLSVLGWGVGGIEAEAAMLGQPITMLIPEVVGFKLKGSLSSGVTATDLVLSVVEILRKHGVVGKFVEFYGQGVGQLSMGDRATLANMAPEYGATCGFFPIDDELLNYLSLSGRSKEHIDLTKAYAQHQGLWMDDNDEDPSFSFTIELDLSNVVPCISGPKRPQDRISLDMASSSFIKDSSNLFSCDNLDEEYEVKNCDFKIKNGDIVIAAITSCTNTSNPSVLIAAGLLAKKANELGLKVKPWVKTSLAPGSKVVTDYLIESGLQSHLDALGFYLVGYGCTTCIGNSGPLSLEISNCINENNLLAVSVLSGNRNFEGRISPDVKANYLASPPLVVAYALAGNMSIDIVQDPLGKNIDKKDVYLKDIWPTIDEINDVIKRHINSKMYKQRYSNVFSGDKLWQEIKTTSKDMYSWQDDSTYIRNPTFFEDIGKDKLDNFEIEDARILALLGDSVTTDHISPAGAISIDSPAAKYLQENNIQKEQFNSYGSRRGNHEVMMRGTFANIRIKNQMLPGLEGGYTKHIPSNKQMTVYDASVLYKKENTPLVIIAGKEYGTGSSRDWAAKGTYLQGVKAVIVESFERIHRSNLVGMGVLPLQFKNNLTWSSLKLIGDEKISIKPIGELRPSMDFKMIISYRDGTGKTIDLLSRVDTNNELNYFIHGGILRYVLHQLK